jgi:hypothetical protein
MNNQENHHCPYCNAAIKKYWHRLTPLLVNTLVKFRSAVVRKNRNQIHVPDELELNTTEYNNFQKLRFHGLVAKFKEDGERKSGFWLLTKRGALFLKGELAVPIRVQTFRNEVVDHDEHKVYVSDVIQSTPYLETIDSIEYEIQDLPNRPTMESMRRKVEDMKLQASLDKYL